LARPEKHSLTLSGHRTSVSLEAEFWRAFRAIAKAEGRPINALAAEIDATRDPETGLASAIRLHVLAWYQRGRPDPAPSFRSAREP
jgi:predicted DNA-binding ribbon-helix-helix protein